MSKKNGTKAKKPTRSEVLQLVREYDYEWCRMLGHSWEPPNGRKPIEVVTVKGQKGVRRGLIAVPFHCPRCDGTRIDYMNRRGHLDSRRYDMPEGFYMPGLGDLRPSKDDWRREVIGRLGV